MPFVKGQIVEGRGRKAGKVIDTAITFRVAKQERDDFINTCNALGLGNAKVLRSFMKKFVEEHQEDEEVLQYLESQKVQEVS